MILPQKATMLTQHRGVRQFVKFGIVGVSSTVINFAVLNLMLAMTHHRYFSATVAFLVSVVNGYIWNKKWTFKEAQAKAVHTQFIQFLLVNLIGLGLDLLIIGLLSGPCETLLHHSYPHLSTDSVFKIATNLAQLVATAVIVFWNFFANRLWTFKH
jgi:putative flippase GtrA